MDVVVKVAEGDLPLFVDGVMDGVDVVIDALIHTLHPSGHKDLPLQGLGTIGRGLLLQFVDELVAFLHRDKSAGLYRVHQQFEFRQLEVSFTQVIPSPTLEDNVIALVPQGLYITIHALPFRHDPVGLELIQQLGDGQRMVLIALPLEDMEQKQELFFVLIL